MSKSVCHRWGYFLDLRQLVSGYSSKEHDTLFERCGLTFWRPPTKVESHVPLSQAWWDAGGLSPTWAELMSTTLKILITTTHSPLFSFSSFSTTSAIMFPEPWVGRWYKGLLLDNSISLFNVITPQSFLKVLAPNWLNCIFICLLLFWTTQKRFYVGS